MRKPLHEVLLQSSYISGSDLEDATPAPCDSVNLLTCFLPIVAFALSDDAQRLTPAQSTGKITQAQFTQLCELVQPAAQCFKTFSSRCVARNFTDVHVAADGAVEFLKFCQKPDAFNKAELIFECSHKLKLEHKQCSDRMKSAVPTDLDTSNPGKLLERQNAMRDLCCHMKKYENCFMPEVSNKCSADATSANQDFINNIYSSFKCSTHLGNCPSS
ncbi:uncharacterized protein LOC129585911 isoform X2 [Paramacrobiotus metropolitanus]|uniref:uncharacterized protein LOC129585911 isoform X2 n=1 Tax=Paramacrobiotus metropolitanus TaxID=2943436 RepID=UPI002445AE4D|nr:uncharacterized protein LOC129585911 isoform X2 [Paramacrobiotus metropolitanus]